MVLSFGITNEKVPPVFEAFQYPELTVPPVGVNDCAMTVAIINANIPIDLPMVLMEVLLMFFFIIVISNMLELKIQILLKVAILSTRLHPEDTLRSRVHPVSPT